MDNLRARLRAFITSIEVLDVFLVVCLALFAYGLNLIHPALPFIALGGFGLMVWAGLGARSG